MILRIIILTKKERVHENREEFHPKRKNDEFHNTGELSAFVFFGESGEFFLYLTERQDKG